MKLLSWNVNGLRSVTQKGYLKWQNAHGADFVCLQEIKASEAQCDVFAERPKGSHVFWNSAEKPGYSGVLIYAKKEPLDVRAGLGDPEIDREGRVLTLETKNFFLVNAYFPNSQRERARLPFKLKFCSQIQKHLTKLSQKKSVLLCGDLNIAHREIDLKNPKSNRDNAGFLPEERAWLDLMIDEKQWVDSFREYEKGPGHYTWWSYRPGVREKNVGWRIDYFLTDPGLHDRLKSAWIESHVTGSDHCPVGVQLKN